jgi:hypothetical protein
MFLHSFFRASLVDHDLARQIKLVPANRRRVLVSEMTKDKGAGNGFFIGSTVVIEHEPFPKLNVVLVNHTKQSQVVTGVDVVVNDYSPAAGIPETQILRPMAVIDVDLPSGLGSFSYDLATPIQVAPDDAVTVSLRLSKDIGGNKIHPGKDGFHQFYFVFITATGLILDTDSFQLTSSRTFVMSSDTAPNVK